ncbi:regulator [Pontibacillus chungwhensis BH030062]|uniref:Regulator n=2 Tax=Pontibacillus TaxID=289201 RepID=A0A0A2UZ29_9BACI|nr:MULTISPECIES: YlbF family regulator [Pontibacillus]KGP92033.1 regulator [Pontibacillus chungwhensis BH030062]GGD19273.1 regulator [Pontibacillus salipaludis]
MLATSETVEILDQSEQLGKLVSGSDVYERYLQAKQDMERDREAQRLIRAFQDSKTQYEEVERFGRYHPDYNQIMKAVRQKKRDMDMNDYVAAYKVAERELQKLLDELSQIIAGSISPQIKVPKDGAVFQDTGGGCGCGSGGGCGCS